MELHEVKQGAENIFLEPCDFHTHQNFIQSQSTLLRGTICIPTKMLFEEIFPLF